MGRPDDDHRTEEKQVLRRVLVVALLMALVAMNHFNRTSMPIAGAEQLIPNVGIDEESMGDVYTSLLIAYTICMTPGGWLTDWWGPWRSLVVMGFGTALFVVLTGVVGVYIPSISGLLIGFIIVRALAGALSAPIHPSASRAVSFWVPPARQSRVNGLVNGAAMIGIACTFHVFGGLMDFFGWRMAFVIAGVATAVVAVIWTMLGADRPETQPSRRTDDKQSNDSPASPASPKAPTGMRFLSGKPPLLKNRSLLLVTLSYVALGYFEFMLFYWLQYYFKNVMNASVEESRNFTMYCNLAMGAGMLSGGWFSDLSEKVLGRRLGRAVFIVAAMMVGGAFLAMARASDGSQAVVWFALSMFAAGTSEGPFWTTAIELGGKRGATSAAIFNTGGNVGGLVAPWATPRLMRQLGWNYTIGVSVIGLLVGAILWIWIDPAERLPHDR